MAMTDLELRMRSNGELRLYDPQKRRTLSRRASADALASMSREDQLRMLEKGMTLRPFDQDQVKTLLDLLNSL